MKQKFSDENAQIIIRVINDNNPTGILDSLRADGIVVKSRDDNKAVLFSLYKSDPQRWSKIMKDVVWDAQADNYTTSTTFNDILKEGLVNSGIEMRTTGDQSTTAKSFLQEAIDTFVGTDTTNTTTNTTTTAPAAGSMTTKIIIAVGIFLALVAIIYFVTKSPIKP